MINHDAIYTVVGYRIQCMLCNSRKSDSPSWSCCSSCKRMERSSSSWKRWERLRLAVIKAIQSWPYQATHRINASKWVRRVASCFISVFDSRWQCGQGWSFTGSDPRLVLHDSVCLWNSKSMKSSRWESASHSPADCAMYTGGCWGITTTSFGGACQPICPGIASATGTAG